MHTGDTTLVFRKEVTLMKLILARIGTHPTVRLALQELARTLRAMDTALFIEERVYSAYDSTQTELLWVGETPLVTSTSQDIIHIDVTDGQGVITAANPRAVLIAVYRFLNALGCRYLFPGSGGEMIPRRSLKITDISAQQQHTPSYHYRGMCIEGALSYEHVRDMIQWLPKVGMNTYFMQFQTPSDFFKRFYNSTDSPYLPATPVTDQDVSHIWAALEEEITQRSLQYHAVGHGWTCEPFGVPGTGWDVHTGEIPESIAPYLAQVNGIRGFWGGIPLNTNLCYFNPIVRRTMIAAIADYCQQHPGVDHLHVWLADGANNHCECEECIQTTPSDAYVCLLNELDEVLTARSISTRIVALIYVDLLWEPKTERIQHPDRFVLMFAPITRTYSHAFAEFDLDEPIELAPYIRNKLKMPSSVAENVARLKKWQSEQLPGDSFDFDYHLMWDHYIDPGYMECAHILHADMVNLEQIGLGGMVSCQTQRAAFPTGLPMYAMAGALWDRSSGFEDICQEYFAAAYGQEALRVRRYLQTLSELFDPVYVRAEKPKNPGYIRKNCEKAKALIENFAKEMALDTQSEDVSWQRLAYHAQLCSLYADVLIAYLGDGNEQQQADAKAALIDALYRAEPHIHAALDVNNMIDSIFRRYLRRHVQR